MLSVCRPKEWHDWYCANVNPAHKESDHDDDALWTARCHSWAGAGAATPSRSRSPLPTRTRTRFKDAFTRLRAPVTPTRTRSKYRRPGSGSGGSGGSYSGGGGGGGDRSSSMDERNRKEGSWSGGDSWSGAFQDFSRGSGKNVLSGGGSGGGGKAPCYSPGSTLHPAAFALELCVCVFCSRPRNARRLELCCVVRAPRCKRRGEGIEQSTSLRALFSIHYLTFRQAGGGSSSALVMCCPVKGFEGTQTTEAAPSARRKQVK